LGFRVKETIPVNVSDLMWRKSSRSGNGGNGNCVEVAFAESVVAVRDSKKPDAGMLTLPQSAWTTFLTAGRQHQR
jgi:Domain of unknown function (DUF397)